MAPTARSRQDGDGLPTTPRTPRTRAAAAAEDATTTAGGRAGGGGARPPLPAHLRMRLNVDYHLNDTAHEFPVASSSFSTDGSEDGAAAEEEVVTPRRRRGGARRKPLAAAAAAAAAQASSQSEHHHHHHHSRSHEPFTRGDWGNMALLVLLYAMQGIPLGLTMGAL
jgi:hypothetical protein